MLDSKNFYYFLYCILFFVICGIVIIRFARLLSYLFFSNDYFSKHYNEIKPIIKVKNKKTAWILSFLVPFPVICGLYFLKTANIGDFFWYLSFYTKPKTAFYLLGFIYFVEALIFLIIILEQKLARKIYKSKLSLILETLFYTALLVSFCIIGLKYICLCFKDKELYINEYL